MCVYVIRAFASARGYKYIVCAKLRYAYQQEPLLSTAKLLEYARVEITTG